METLLDIFEILCSLTIIFTTRSWKKLISSYILLYYCVWSLNTDLLPICDTTLSNLTYWSDSSCIDHCWKGKLPTCFVELPCTSKTFSEYLHDIRSQPYSHSFCAVRNCQFLVACYRRSLILEFCFTYFCLFNWLSELFIKRTPDSHLN